MRNKTLKVNYKINKIPLLLLWITILHLARGITFKIKISIIFLFHTLNFVIKKSNLTGYMPQIKRQKIAYFAVFQLFCQITYFICSTIIRSLKDQKVKTDFFLV